METFYIVRVVDKEAKAIRAIDYPQDFPIPSTGDWLVIKDNDHNHHAGTVTERIFSVLGHTRQITIILQID